MCLYWPDYKTKAQNELNSQLVEIPFSSELERKLLRWEIEQSTINVTQLLPPKGVGTTSNFPYWCILVTPCSCL